jgi:hypothetical protein
MPGVFESLLILPVLGWGVLWIWALVDIGSRDDEDFRAVGESKAIWFVVVLVLQFFGLLGYLLWTRPKLVTRAPQ